MTRFPKGYHPPTELKPGNKNAEKYTEADAIKIGEGLIKWLKKPPVISNTIAGKKIESMNLYKIKYLSMLGHSKDFTNRLAARFASFRDLLAQADTIQEANLLTFSAINKINANIAMFSLRCNHGFIEADRAQDIKEKVRMNDLKEKELELKMKKLSEVDNLMTTDIEAAKRRIKELIAENGFSDH